MKKDVYELTNPQKSIWLTEEFYKGTAINNIGGNLLIREKVDFEKLLLDTIISNPGLNAPSLSKRLGRSLRTTQRYLKKLSDKKLIIFKGVAKTGGYFGI